MMVWSALVVALFLAPFVAAEDYLGDAMKALDAGQPAAAEPLLRKAVAAAPGDYYAHFNLALVLGMQEKNEEAIAEYRKTLTLKPGLFEADLNLGILFLRGSQPVDALPVLKEAVELKPAESRPQFFYAQALFDTGDFAEAEKHYRAAADVDAKSAVARLGIARSLVRQSKLADSAEFYRAAAALDPSLRNGLLELGSEYDKAGRAAEAIAIYKEYPENAAVAERLATLLVDNNKAAEALPALEAAVRRNPSTDNRLALADAYKQTNQMPKAAEQLQAASANDPRDFDLHMMYGRVLRDQRQFGAAAQQFRSAAALRPESVSAWNELAGSAVLGENYAEGLAALDRVRTLGKEIPGNMYLRAITLDRLRQKPQALQAYREFLAVADGKYPDQEFLARQRARIIGNELNK